MHVTLLPGVTKASEQNPPGFLQARSRTDENEDAFDTVFGDLEANNRTSQLSGDQVEAIAAEGSDQPEADAASSPNQENPAGELLGNKNSGLDTNPPPTEADTTGPFAVGTYDQSARETGNSQESDHILPNATAPSSGTQIRTGIAAALVNGAATGGPVSASGSVKNSELQSVHNATLMPDQHQKLGDTQPVRAKGFDIGFSESVTTSPISSETKNQDKSGAQREANATAFPPKSPRAQVEQHGLPTKDFETGIGTAGLPEQARNSPLFSHTNSQTPATGVQASQPATSKFPELQLPTRASAKPGSDRVQPNPRGAAEKANLNARSQLSTSGAAIADPPGGAGVQQRLRLATAPVSDRSLMFPGEAMEETAWDIRPQLTPSGTASSVATGRPEMPPQIVQMITEAIHRSPDKAIEIALSPAELGRVRMVLTTSEGGIVVNILAERADTLDLMRRNIDDLGRSFSELGYTDISFAFGKGGDASDNTDTPDQKHGEVEGLSLDLTTAPAASETAQPRLAITDDGVDMRV